jgi:hypothetical protein
MSKNLPSTLALAAAALFLSGCQKQQDGATTSPDDGAKAANIRCFGVNECSGQGACNVPDGRVEAGSKGHACGGLNECRGKGWILLTQTECDAKGGEPV